MFGMSISDFVGIVIATISLFVAVIIGIAQLVQNANIKKITIKQEERDKQLRNQFVIARRNEFIAKYRKNYEIYLLPLCWTASKIDPSRRYQREMYLEYNALEEDIQFAICEYMKFSPPTFNGDKDTFKRICTEAIQQEEARYSGEDPSPSIFYNGAKYIFQGMNYSALPACEYNIKKMFKEIDENSNIPLNKKIFITALVCGFRSGNEALACEVCSDIAILLAIWRGAELGIEDEKFWVPGTYAGEELETVEDVALCAVFCIYTHLVAPITNANAKKIS